MFQTPPPGYRRHSCSDRTLQILTALVAITVATAAIIGIIFSSEQNSLQRFCLTATGTQEVNSTSAGEMIGAISLMTNERMVGWEFQYGDFSGIPIELQIRGPKLPGHKTGPLALALCGVPSSLACDTSVAGQLQGLIDQTGAGGQPLKPTIQAIRDQPWRYYVQVNTGAYPMGEVSAPLTSLCGTP